MYLVHIFSQHMCAHKAHMLSLTLFLLLSSCGYFNDPTHGDGKQEYNKRITQQIGGNTYLFYN